MPVGQQEKMPLGQRTMVVKSEGGRRGRSPEKIVTKGMRGPCKDKSSRKLGGSQDEGSRVYEENEDREERAELTV